MFPQSGGALVGRFSGISAVDKGEQVNQRKQGGFTLIELMLVIVIMGVLMAIAIPNYQEYVRKSARSAAQAQMMDIANRQQQFLLANRTYASKSELETSGYSLPAEVSDRYTYSITVGAGTVPSFTITFTAGGAQAPDGDLTLNSEGVKTPPEKW